jgi:hypothetical protein
MEETIIRPGSKEEHKYLEYLIKKYSTIRVLGSNNSKRKIL